MFPVKASADSRYKKRLSLQIQDDDADTHMYSLTWFLNKTGEWVVEAMDEEGGGEVCLATFSGPGLEARAKEYVAWKEGARLIRRPPKEASCVQREGWVVF